MFKHPNYYKNLRKLARLRNSDQAISLHSATAASERAPGSGLKLQAQCDSQEALQSQSRASSFKQQAPSCRRQANQNLVQVLKHQAASVKPQAASFKRQATSCKLRDPRTTEQEN